MLFVTEPCEPRGKSVEELTAFLAKSIGAGHGNYLKIDIEAEIQRVEQWLAEIGAQDVFIGPVVDGKAVCAFTLPPIVTMLIIPPIRASIAMPATPAGRGISND